MFSCSEKCLTTVFLLLGLALVAWAAWRERRWHGGLDAPLVPTTPLMFLGALTALLALAHLLTLAGITRP